MVAILSKGRWLYISSRWTKLGFSTGSIPQLLMTWRREEPSHQQAWYWPDFPRIFCCLNTLRPRQNGQHFADDISQCIFLNEDVWIPIKISLKFVLKCPINNILALVQIMAWRRPGDKPLSEPMMVKLMTHICVTRPQWVNGKVTVCTDISLIFYICKHHVSYFSMHSHFIKWCMYKYITLNYKNILCSLSYHRSIICNTCP